jgi:hypothetical protein
MGSFPKCFRKWPIPRSIDAVRHESHECIRIFGSRNYLRTRQGFPCGVGDNIGASGQQFDDFRVHPVGEDDFGLHKNLCKLWELFELATQEGAEGVDEGNHA